MQNLFPLPLWYDNRAALNEILDDAQVKDKPGGWRRRGDTKAQAAKALRGIGLRAWHGLVVVMLNYIYGDRAKGNRPTPSGQATAPQEKALETLWDLVRTFMDLPGLPSADHGGLVDILAVLPEDLQSVVKHPERLVLENPEGAPPRPKVHASSLEWGKLARALYERGIVKPVTRCPTLGGQNLLMLLESRNLGRPLQMGSRCCGSSWI